MEEAQEPEIRSIVLDRLRHGSHGITPEFGGCLVQAACVCLAEQRHNSPCKLSLKGDFEGIFALIWENPSDQMIRCWNDDQVATENGAYGIATLLVFELTNLQVLERSKKGTGFDYWLGDLEDSGPLFQNKARLEVSGIRKGGNAIIEDRVRTKLEQTKRSDGSLPAVVAVIEFGTPQSRIITKWKK